MTNEALNKMILQLKQATNQIKREKKKGIYSSLYWMHLLLRANTLRIFIQDDPELLKILNDFENEVNNE